MINIANKYWNSLDSFRRERLRCKNYTFGRQWEDYINVDGCRIKEEDYIKSQGNVPLKNNLIRRIVRNVLGLYRNYYSLPSLGDIGLPETSDNLLLYSRFRQTVDENDLRELYSRVMEEFLISGMAVVRKRIGIQNGLKGVWTEPVSPEGFFFNDDLSDPRGRDVSTVGQIHETDFPSLCAAMNASPDVQARLLEIYGSEEAKCRVVEIWKREFAGSWICHDRRSATVFRSSHPMPESSFMDCRWQNKEVWRYYFLSPDGRVLKSGVSPYPDGRHPFIFKLYPFIDGEIHSFVSDLIDQQRYVNRLITLHDWIMRASAKGVLLMPDYAVPDDCDINDVIDEWSRFNGVIVYHPKSGMPQPQQISVNSTDIGIAQLLDVQLKMMEDVSGVNSAIQGKVESGATSGALFNMQTRQAMNGLLDILDCFHSFVKDATRKDFAFLASLPSNPT